MQSNAEIFIEIYNAFDKLLPVCIGKEQIPFSEKIRSSKNKLIVNNQQELIDYGSLRNAIVHNNKIGGKHIAEPHDEVVKNFKDLYNIFKNPKKVFPEFGFGVFGSKEDDLLMLALKEMKLNSFSQFPILNDNNHVIEIINTNTISRWLSSNINTDGSIILENIRVRDLIEEIEFKNNYKFISKSKNIFEAYQYFVDQVEKERRNLDALFITETGKNNEKILGLITIEDIACMI